MNNLKELREQLGLQQKEFCEPLGIKQTTYSMRFYAVLSVSNIVVTKKEPPRREALLHGNFDLFVVAA